MSFSSAYSISLDADEVASHAGLPRYQSYGYACRPRPSNNI